MRFEKKEFEVRYDAKRVKSERMLEVIRGLGFRPTVVGPVQARKNTIPDTKEFGALLSRIVKDGKVDYVRVATERKVLDRYLTGVAKADLAKADKRTVLAFYINAYNAAALSLVVKYVRGKGPKGADLKGVLAVKDFFKKKEIRVGNELISLNELEARGRELGDPRIHFAVNCASISCPVLLDRAWTPETLDKDLDAATTSYFASEHGLQIKGDRLHVTALLKWYKDDFGGEEGVRAFLLRYAPKAAKKRLDGDIAFLDYDWRLNKQRSGRGSS